MYPVPLLFLLLAALNSGVSTTSESKGDIGLKFVVAFPENIAYYHPEKPTNKVQITALRRNTRVTFQSFGSNTTRNMNAGETVEFPVQEGLELNETETSQKTLVITSNKKITVSAISIKGNSVQTALVIPVAELGKKYLIPPIPKIQGTTDQVTSAVNKGSPFKLVIISVDRKTNVTVEGAQVKTFSLQPLQITQIVVQEGDKVRAVKANRMVAVLFTHPCAMQYNCTCGLLYNMLQPAKRDKLKFFIPPHLVEGNTNEISLLLAKKNTTNIEPFDPDSPVVEKTASAILFRPGLLLTLIPETDFASCFVVSPISHMQTSAIIMVHKDFTDGVHIEEPLQESTEWQEVKGTEYVSTEVSLLYNTTFIWHTSYKMAVYIVGRNGNALFGHPAPIISRSPDFQGCPLITEVIEIGNVASTWQKSVKYCEDKNLTLISISKAEQAARIYKTITQANNSLQEMWIGMRRRSATSEWYWLNGDPVNYTNWGEREPGAVGKGQCVIMRLEKGEKIGWSDERCCKAAYPLCYRKPVILPLSAETEQAAAVDRAGKQKTRQPMFTKR